MNRPITNEIKDKIMNNVDICDLIINYIGTISTYLSLEEYIDTNNYTKEEAAKFLDECIKHGMLFEKLYIIVNYLNSDVGIKLMNLCLTNNSGFSITGNNTFDGPLNVTVNGEKIIIDGKLQ